ncbi:tRNA pseudouridine(38-40) synthase TruA [Massilia violaceinigra]|uniref:tRNA pseudouridine synthase A n=1 Tax=Massilia violaceinigra TaxID=2045208 RepID=A0ABY4ADG7_9BURK|nr:tRNA pseudouridine(38-40) synthase TruA [Massilia violaceinigra]UOD30623.1 tRNA pseudouridine(38-40) synthase TruA [Massilia violaceinigra]
MKRIALGVQYDGTAFNGYQKQPDRNTVQDRLEIALEKFARVELGTTCAGRTDTGVHALEQVVHFDTGIARSMQSWVRGVNTFLPDSIAVRWATEVPEHPGQEFHARFAAFARTYHYVLYNNPIRSPLLAGRAGWVFRPLDVDLMRAAAQCLVGTHDFSAFRSSQCQAKSPVKQMHAVHIERHGEVIVFTLRASAFLHHMVRNLIGSLIYVGQGRHTPAWMKDVLEGRDRNDAAPTFMPDGLYLARIDYDPKWGLPHEAARPLPWF